MFCQERFPNLICRPVSVHALSDNSIAMFELTLHDDQVRVIDQKHYTLVPASAISDDDLHRYNAGE